VRKPTSVKVIVQDPGRCIKGEVCEIVCLFSGHDEVYVGVLRAPLLEGFGGTPNVLIVQILLLAARHLREARCERAGGILKDMAQGRTGAAVIRGRRA
jgi:hypothetical protein